MSIASEIQRLQQAKADIAEAIVAKGGEVSGTIDNYAPAIEALPSGGGLKVLEGEITLATRNCRITIVHNLGVTPLQAEVELKETQEPAVNYCPIAVAYYKYPYEESGVTASKLYNSSLVLGNSAGINNYASATDAEIVVYTNGTARYFYPTTYKYKIYYIA